MRYHRMPFSVSAELVARRPFTMQGRQYEAGDIVEKGGVTPRTLKLLYDQRKVEVQVDENGDAVLSKPKAETKEGPKPEKAAAPIKDEKPPAPNQDAAASKDPLAEMTRAELINAAKAKGIPYNGTADQIRARLMEGAAA